MNKPVVFYSGNTVVRPGNIVIVRGEYLDQLTNAVMSDGKHSKEVPLLQHERQSFKVEIPREFDEGIYTLECSGLNPLTVVLNAPIVRWMQGDEGETATPDGWLRLQGECLRITADAKIYAELSNARGVSIRLLPDRVYDDYSVGFTFSGMPTGSYHVTYSNGYSVCDCGQIEITPSPESFWGQKVYNVTAYGLSKNSAIDCTQALNQLLTQVGADGGGIIYFPRGRYRLTGPIRIPRRVILRGESYRNTQIFWTDEWRDDGRQGEWMPTQLPEYMLISDGDFAMENLEFAAARIGRFLKAGTSESPIKNVRLDHVRVNVNAFYDINGRHHQRLFIDVLKEVWHGWDENELDLLCVYGTNVKIRNCHFYWSGRFCNNKQKNRYFLMQNSVIAGTSSVRYWGAMGDMNNAILEDNEFKEWDVGCGGDNVYIARTKIEDTSCGYREGFTTDISSGIDYYKTATGSADRFTFPDEVDMTRAVPGSKLCILSGTGAGQFRYVKQVEDHTVILESPFEVEPDVQSCMTVNFMFNNWYFVDMVMENAGQLQFYVAQGNTVIDGAKFIRSFGAISEGKRTYRGVQNMWYHSMINCELSECDCFYNACGWWHGIGKGFDDKDAEKIMKQIPGFSFLYVIGLFVEPLPITMGFVVRNNRIRDDGIIGIYSKGNGLIKDVIVQGNEMTDNRCGIYIIGQPEGLIMADNVFNNVEEEVCRVESLTCFLENE